MNYTKFYRAIQGKLEADKCTTHTQKVYFLSVVLDAMQDALSEDTDKLKTDIQLVKEKQSQSIIALDVALNLNKN